MSWNRSKSLLLSQICVAVFMVLLAALDIGGYWAVEWFMHISRAVGNGLGDGILLMCILYSGSVCGWLLLVKLWRLLTNIRNGQVFCENNISCLRISCWCCTAVFVILGLSTFYYVLFGIIAAAAGFTALIIHIIKNVFEQAIQMKDELDFTV